jgi:hypothetical protein
VLDGGTRFIKSNISDASVLLLSILPLHCYLPFTAELLRLYLCIAMSIKPVPLRKLGKDGPRVPALGFGLMGMSFAYGTILSDEERFRTLDRAVELGETFWDSAE